VRGQHHIPQFLLKGFASRARKKNVFTWLFRNEMEPVEANVTGIAKIRDFYGPSDVSPVEHTFSIAESSFAQLLRRLRDGRGLDDGLSICQFVASTQIRTNNLRTGMESGVRMFMSEMMEAFADPNQQRALSARAFRNVLEKAEKGELDHLLNGLTSFEKRQFLENLEPLLRTKMDEQMSEWVEALIRVAEPMRLAYSCEGVQNKVLRENLFPTARVEGLLELLWHVEFYEPKSLILGDVAVIAQNESGEFCNLLTQEEPLVNVYLPISSDRLLVGQRIRTVPPVSTALNTASAELSREFFIAAELNSETARLRSALGNRAEFVSESEMKSIVLNSMTGVIQK
jgi:hypothetical protein